VPHAVLSYEVAVYSVDSDLCRLSGLPAYDQTALLNLGSDLGDAGREVILRRIKLLGDVAGQILADCEPAPKDFLEELDRRLAAERKATHYRVT
tara:strand:- start:74 stop:355 length:282 start_codon:yes stop_codon:yes gene_type:complete